MNAKPKHGASARDSAGLAVKTLCSHLMPAAQERTARQVVAGVRFCAVMLDDGGTGVANLCPDVCGEPSRRVSDRLPQRGTPAADVLATLGSSTRSALGLATANALANRPGNWGGMRDAAVIGGDLLEVLELRPDDHVGMVGCFSPLVEPIRQRVGWLSIFERAPRLTPDLLPENRAAELLPECSVALITATTLMNGTIDALLDAAANCREVVLLGPSTPLAPQVFADPPRRASLLSGMVVTDAEELLRVIARGAGTRDFKSSIAKVNIRANASGSRRPKRWPPDASCLRRSFLERRE
jgi:uncharacterized protein (DUF4213/DUF364 family)